MVSDRQCQLIAARMSLREPQKEALDILADVVSLQDPANGRDDENLLSLIKEKYPTVSDFERTFPSLCFALATGVGKTRLMGAFISYLYLTERSRHFFVLAPNLTIYEKLIADFTPGSPKYVFKGIGEFANNPPLLITGENYESGIGVKQEFAGTGTVIQGQLFEVLGTAYVNIFNVSKINSEVREGRAPRIKQLREYIGESYFDYLSGLDDLVLLMDEAHRYRASAGVRAINDLKPILGLELTATPQIEAAGRSIPFKNVVYSYPLSKALKDGFVKDPAVATRKDFKPQEYSEEQLERIKLEDGIHHHEYVKVELEIFSRQNGMPVVKPFILIIAQDVEHARTLKSIVEGEDFFGGRYKGKVIEVHSKLRGLEEDENVQRLLAVERADEKTEIVIHVNKLKEGWDVTNLYTIVPLRAASSKTLVEQSIGRGLRLPYGRRVGVAGVDRLTIIAHDRFQDIVDEANNPDSVIRSGILIGEDIPLAKPQVVVIPSVAEAVATGWGEAEGHNISQSLSSIRLETAEERQVAAITYEVLKRYERLPSSEELTNATIQEKIEADVRQMLSPSQLQLAFLGADSDIRTVVQKVTELVVQTTIDIPKIVVVPSKEVNFGFNNFDLYTSSINYQPVSDEILIQYLRTNERELLSRSGGDGREERLEDYLVSYLIDKNEVCYEEQAELLYKLAGQVVERLRSYLPENKDVINVLQHRRKALGELIFAQLMEHCWETPCDYTVHVSKGFMVLRESNCELPAGEKPRNVREPVEQRSSIKSMLFTGFSKCCFPAQKFDSDPERRFAVILEDDKDVLKWMKPSQRSFRIEYKNGREYEPDFVVETELGKFLCEPKGRTEMASEDVKAKTRAAVLWCKHASEHARQNGGKPWRYVLIPDDVIQFNMSFLGLINEFEVLDSVLTEA